MPAVEFLNSKTMLTKVHGSCGRGRNRMQDHARFFERTRTDAVTRTQNRLSFICERARKVAKNSLMLKINRLEKSKTTPLKFDSDPMENDPTRPDPKPSSRLKSTFKVHSQVQSRQEHVVLAADGMTENAIRPNHYSRAEVCKRLRQPTRTLPSPRLCICLCLSACLSTG